MAHAPSPDMTISASTWAQISALSALLEVSEEAALAAAVAEVLLRERVAFSCREATAKAYGGLVPDGTIRLQPTRLEAC